MRNYLPKTLPLAGWLGDETLTRAILAQMGRAEHSMLGNTGGAREPRTLTWGRSLTLHSPQLGPRFHRL